jgi:DNA modification methylase
MFPLDFPFKILKRRALKGDLILDPFCGRGTTNFAARLLGLSSLAVDSSPVAAAITAAKLVTVTAKEIVDEAQMILAQNKPPTIPQGEFWDWAFHHDVLHSVCQLRDSFLQDCTTRPRIALRGLILGALHGPRQKIFSSYLSNQCPRTYAPKPDYSVRFWKEKKLTPQPVDVVGIVSHRAKRYYSEQPTVFSEVRLSDSREEQALSLNGFNYAFNWIITSPPYYGMRTYIPDQWLRNWFVGGSDTVDYSNNRQIAHSSPKVFIDNLHRVWQNTARVSRPEARLIIRFGGISDRRVSPLDLIKQSLIDSGWQISAIRRAGTSDEGKRQADSFLRKKSIPLTEYDIWAKRAN